MARGVGEEGRKPSRNEDHRRITYPRSVGKPEQTKEEYLKNTGELLSLWTGDLDVSCTLGCHSISPC